MIHHTCRRINCSSNSILLFILNLIIFRIRIVISSYWMTIADQLQNKSQQHRRCIRFSTIFSRQIKIEIVIFVCNLFNKTCFQINRIKKICPCSEVNHQHHRCLSKNSSCKINFKVMCKQLKKKSWNKIWDNLLCKKLLDFPMIICRYSWPNFVRRWIWRNSELWHLLETLSTPDEQFQFVSRDQLCFQYIPTGDDFSKIQFDKFRYSKPIQNRMSNWKV